MSDNLIVGLTFSFNREFNLLDVCKELNILLSDISSFSIQNLNIYITMTNGEKHKCNLMHFLKDLYMTDTDYNYPGVATYVASEGPIKLIDSVGSSEDCHFDNKGNLIVDPCIYCNKSTAFGSGLFVDRIPANRLCEDTNRLIEGYECAVCGTPELCIECEQKPPQDVHHFRCDTCEEKI